MSLMATSIEPPGIARIFFDLRAVAPSPDEEQLIAEAIERAFALAAMDNKAGERSRAN
jgi:hypothetical protein